MVVGMVCIPTQERGNESGSINQPYAHLVAFREFTGGLLSVFLRSDLPLEKRTTLCNFQSYRLAQPLKHIHQCINGELASLTGHHVRDSGPIYVQ